MMILKILIFRVFEDTPSVSHLFYYDSSFSSVESFRMDLSIFRIPQRTIRQMIENYSLRDRISVTQKKIRKDPQRRRNVVKGLHSPRNVQIENIVDSIVTFLFSSSSSRTGSLEISLFRNVPHKELDTLPVTQAMMP